MFAGIYSAGSAIRTAEIMQEATAQNLSHVNMPGYRRVVNAFATIDAATSDHGIPSPALGAKEALSVDFRVGVNQRTERPLDVALDGDGFLTVDTPRGIAYTRDGVMHINEEGQIVNTGGDPYEGLGTVPPEITPSQISIDQTGAVFAAGQQIGQLEIVRFDDVQTLQPIGPTLFQAGTEAPKDAAATTTVLQGSRELSNVHATDELIHMLIGMRHHQAAQRALHSLSETMREHLTGGR